MGVIFALVMILGAYILTRGTFLFANIILFTSYAVFYIAEVHLKVSGILALVFAGLTLNTFL